MTSGAPIYAALIGMWALVLVPLWLRRHDQAQEIRSADRFARAMGSLRRRSPSVEGENDMVMPRRARSLVSPQVTVTGPGPQDSGALQATMRRRRVLAVLGGLLVL